MFGILILIMLLVMLFKLTALLLSLGSRMIGIVLSMVGYLIIAFLAIGILGLAAFVFPLILIAGAVSLIFYLCR